MKSEQTQTVLTPETYLTQEAERAVRHELIDGEIFAMAGASANHERIVQNLSRKLGNFLEGSPCEPFSSDMKVRARDNFYYPDFLVDCSFDESEPYYTKTPIIIFEIISKSTRKMDEQIKRIDYFNIPSLREYVIIEQDFVDIAVYRKSDQWRHTNYFLGETVTFESLEMSLSIEEIYYRVNNEDMISLLSKQKT